VREVCGRSSTFGRSVWRPAIRILCLVRPYVPAMVAAIALSLLASGLKGAIAWLTKPVINYVFVEGKREYLLALPAGVFVIYILRSIADCSQAYLMADAGLKLVRDLRNRLFENLLAMPVSRALTWKSGDIISRQLMDVALFGHILSDSFSVFLVEFPTVIVLVCVALYRRWDISVLSLIVLPLIGLGTRTFGRLVKRRRMVVQEFLSRITHRMNEAYAGLKIIKIFGMATGKVMQFKEENNKVCHQNSRVVLFKQGTRFFIDLVSGSAVCLIIGWGGWLITEGRMTTGDLFSVIVSLGMLFTPLKRLGSAYNILQESIVVLERIEDYLSVDAERLKGRPVAPLRNSLRLERVLFRYPGAPEPAVRDLDLEFPAGKMTAIVGPSGAGKSTLVDLIAGFVVPGKGRILWDGLDLRGLDLEALRSMIGLVTQEVVLFSDTIRENIAAARPGATDEEITRAAIAAGAHEFIMRLPMGYDTVLDERGLNLSGGQRQRIAMARAILKDPPLLILDEATSSLDTVSEQAVQQAILRLKSGRTTLIVTHRLNMIQHADQIVVLDRGKIAAKGSHEELLAASNLYQELFEPYQKKGYIIPGNSS